MTQSTTPDRLDDRIRQLLRAFRERSPGTSTQAFIEARLLASGASASPAEAQKVAGELCGTVDDIQSAHRRLREAKSRGVSREQWLADELQQALAGQTDPSASVGALKAALVAANQGLAPGESLPAHPLPAGPFTGLAARAAADAFAADLTDRVVLLTGAQSATEGEAVVADALPEAVAFLESPLGDASEADFRKVVAAAAYAEAKAGGGAERPFAVAASTGAGLTQTKVAYQIGSGRVSVPEGIAFLIDAAEAALAVAVKVGCREVGALGGAALGAFLGGLLSPGAASVGAKVGRTVGRQAGQAAGDFLSTGVSYLAEAGRSLVAKSWHKVDKVVGKAGKWLKSVFR